MDSPLASQIRDACQLLLVSHIQNDILNAMSNKKRKKIQIENLVFTFDK